MQETAITREEPQLQVRQSTAEEGMDLRSLQEHLARLLPPGVQVRLIVQFPSSLPRRPKGALAAILTGELRSAGRPLLASELSTRTGIPLASVFQALKRISIVCREEDGRFSLRSQEVVS